MLHAEDPSNKVIRLFMAMSAAVDTLCEVAVL